MMKYASDNQQDKVYNHIYHLSHTIGERNLCKYKNLQEAANYIFLQFHKTTCRVNKHMFLLKNKVIENIEAIIPAKTSCSPSLILGAHYDTAKNTPGANDNATGVAALIELACRIKPFSLPYSIHLVAFANEEPPFIRTKQMGSYQYASYLHKNKVDVLGMISIETIGYYSNEKNSQKYFNFLPNFIYPNIGNFLACVSNLRSAPFLKKFLETFTLHSSFPLRSLIGPGLFPGINSSDQWSFWQFGYQAFMLTDTAPFRYVHYHKSTDTADKLNYKKLAEAITALEKTVTSF